MSYIKKLHDESQIKFSVMLERIPKEQDCFFIYRVDVFQGEIPRFPIVEQSKGRIIQKIISEEECVSLHNAAWPDNQLEPSDTSLIFYASPNMFEGITIKSISETAFFSVIKVKGDRCFTITIDEIPKWDMYGSEGVNVIYLKNTIIGEAGLSRCDSLFRVYTKGISKVGRGACEECSSLEYFQWPDNIKTIPSKCFCFAGSLKNISEIVKKVTKISSNAFYGCAVEQLDLTDVKRIDPAGLSNIICQEVIWSKHIHVIPVRCFAYSSLEQISQLNTVKKIERDAFLGSRIESMDLANSAIDTISAEAFRGSCIEKMSWPADCHEVPYRCFFEGKINVEFPQSSLLHINPEAFKKCSSFSNKENQPLNLDFSKVGFLNAEDNAIEKGSHVITPYYYIGDFE